jgi:hypothetical protein
MTELSLVVRHAAERVPGGWLGQWTAGTVLLKPLAWLYLEGPRAFGFWGGATMADICAQLTNTRAQFWNTEAGAAAECADIVHRHYWSYVVLASSVGYSVALVWSLRRLCDCVTKKTKRRNTLKNG